MNTEEFIQLIKNPNIIKKKQMATLEVILEEYPYFQAAHVIFLKGLKKQKNFKYNSTLKKVASYTNNRSVLFDFITSDVFDYKEHSANETAIIDDIEVIDSNVIEHLYQSIAASATDTISETASTEKENFSKTKKGLKESKDKLALGSPINFDENDAFSFNEWLQLTSKKPIKRKGKEEKKDKIVENKKSNVEKKLDLITDFVINKPKTKPKDSQVNIDVSVDSTTENTTLMTETLARVYLEQKKYSKAITAFKILSLKYPEKSSFFADQIKAINFLQKHKS